MIRDSRLVVSRVLVAASAVLFAAAALAPLQASDELPEQLRAALELPLKKKIEELLKTKDADGVENVRGSYFKRFKKMDDSTYQVVFHKTTALKEERKTERYLLTLKQDPGKNTWSIADEKLERTVEGMFFRSVPSDETFQEFDSFRFEREGISVASGKGTLYVDYLRGQPFRVGLVADDLRYDYAPPVDLNYYQTASILKNSEKYRKDLIFPVEFVFINCDPVSCKEILETAFTGRRDIQLSGLWPKARSRYDEFLHDLEKSRKENPMVGYSLVDRSEHREWRISVKKEGLGDHWAWLEYDNEAPEEIEFHVTKMGDQRTGAFFPIYTYHDAKTRASQTDPYELERRHDLDGLDFDVTGIKGRVELAVLDSGTMNCDVTYGLKVRRDTEVLPMAIAQLREASGERSESKSPSMNISLIEDGNGQELTYVRSGSSSGYLVFPQRLKAGDELQVHLKFENSNAIYQFNPSYSYMSRGGWLPFVRFGDMIDEFDLEIVAPSRYEIIGIGEKISDKIEGLVRVVHFKSNFPVSFPTIIFGDYRSDKPSIEAVKKDGSKIPVGIHVDKVSMMSFSQWKSVEEAIGEITSGIREIRPDSLRPLAEQAVNALNVYREVFDVDYPFKKLDLVGDPVGPSYYGQSPASIVYLGAAVFRPTATLGGGSGDLALASETLVAHEVAHQWWGSLVTMGNSRNYWFVESLAEYSSALFLEALHGSKDPKKGWAAYMKNVDEWRRNILEADLMTSVQDADTMWQGEFPGQARTALIYNQGPYAFHILRMTFGDEKFFAFFKKLAKELQGQEIVTRDIQRVAEESFGGTMDWFFDQWIRGIGIPEYSFNYTVRPAEDNTYIVQGTVKQRIVVGLKKVPLPGKAYRGMITITAVGKDKKEYVSRLRLEGEDTPFTFKVPVEPREVVLNKQGEMLTRDVLVNRAF